MLGDEAARTMLGCLDAQVGNYDRAIKHFMIATGCGNSFALKKIQKCTDMDMQPKVSIRQL